MNIPEDYKYDVARWLMGGRRTSVEGCVLCALDDKTGKPMFHVSQLYEWGVVDLGGRVTPAGDAWVNVPPHGVYCEELVGGLNEAERKDKELTFQKKLNADQEILMAKLRAEIKEQRTRVTAAALALEFERKEITKMREEISRMHDEIADEYHPEFGSFWQPGGDGHKLTQERDNALRSNTAKDEFLKKICALYRETVPEKDRAEFLNEQVRKAHFLAAEALLK